MSIFHLYLVTKDSDDSEINMNIPPLLPILFPFNRNDLTVSFFCKAAARTSAPSSLKLLPPMFLVFDIPAKVFNPCWIRAESTSSPKCVVIW